MILFNLVGMAETWYFVIAKNVMTKQSQSGGDSLSQKLPRLDYVDGSQ